nr:MAG TPA: hypothetical protein [Caudoviricetes sp.]
MIFQPLPFCRCFFCMSKLLFVSCSRCRSSLIDRLIKSISIIISIYFTKIRELLCSPFSEKQIRGPF